MRRGSWAILTSSRELWLTLNKRCDRSHERAECRGMAAQASSYYPLRMRKEMLKFKGMKHAWQQQTSSLKKDVEKRILNVDYIVDFLTSNVLYLRWQRYLMMSVNLNFLEWWMMHTDMYKNSRSWH